MPKPTPAEVNAVFEEYDAANDEFESARRVITQGTPMERLRTEVDLRKAFARLREADGAKLALIERVMRGE